MNNSQIYSERFGLTNVFLLKHEPMIRQDNGVEHEVPNKNTGFMSTDYYNAVKNLVGLGSNTFFNPANLATMMKEEVVLVASPAMALDMDHLCSGVVFLKVSPDEVMHLDEPYPGFCKEFNVEMKNVDKIIYLASLDICSAKYLLWRAEQNIKYSGKTSVYTELEASEHETLQIYADAGYVMKAVGSGDVIEKWVAYKDISKSEHINFFLKDYDAEFKHCESVQNDELKSDEEKAAVWARYEKSISTDYFAEMDSYRLRTNGAETQTVRLMNQAKLLNLMDCGYLVSGFDGGSCLCNQYEGLCTNLQTVPAVEEEAAVA